MNLLKSFDLKERLQVKMLQKMSERIRKVEEMIEKRKSMRDKIISQRLEDLTLDREITKW